MLTIRVGKKPKQKDFIAHESFLTSRSEFFRRAMNGKWAEADSRAVKLPDDKPETFALYLNFVYTGQLITMRKSAEELAILTEDTFVDYIVDEFDDIFRLYVLAEKLQDASAKNAAITAAVEVAQLKSVAKKCTVPSLSTANHVYEGTPEGSPARRFLADMWGTLSLSCILRILQGQNMHKDFVADLGKVLDQTCTRDYPQHGAQAYMEEV